MSRAAERLNGKNGDRKNFDTVTVTTPTAELGVSPQGGFVTRWSVRNPHTGHMQDVLYRGKWIDRNGIPPLFPYFGPGDEPESPPHGFGMYSTWQMNEKLDKKITMTLTQSQLTDENRTKFPYNFTTTITVETEEDGSLIYSMKVKNNGDKPMPISPGIHPYWDIAYDRKGDVVIKDLPDFDASKIDWMNNPPDTAYPFTGSAEIKMPGKVITIEDISPGDPVVQKLNIWSQPFDSRYDNDFLCVEPITRDKSERKTNPINVEPGAEWEMRLKFGVTFIKAK